MDRAQDQRLGHLAGQQAHRWDLIHGQLASALVVDQVVGEDRLRRLALQVGQ